MKKTITILLILLFSGNIISIKGQDSLVDVNLEKRLTSLANDSLRVVELDKWHKRNYSLHPNMAMKYAFKALTLSKKANIKKKEILYMQRIGSLYKVHGKYYKALNMYQKAEEEYSQLGDSIGIAKERNNMGLVYIKLGDYTGALKNFLFSLKVFEKHKRKKYLPLVYNNIGITYKHLNNYSKALHYYKLGLNLKLQDKKHYNLFQPYNNLSNIYASLKQYNKALEYYQKALEYLKEHPNKEFLAMTHLNMGYTYFSMKKYDKALNHLKKNLKLNLEIGNEYKTGLSYDGLSLIYEGQHKYKKALKYRLKSLSYAKRTNNLRLQLTSHEILLKRYCEQNNADSALAHFKLYKTVKDSLLNKEMVHQIAEMQEKYESQKKTQQISFLEKENQTKRFQSTMLMVIVLMVIAFSVYLIIAYYRKKKLNQLLKLQKIRIEWHREKLDIKNQELLQANNTKNKLFQIISHDLRSPLATVSGIAKLVPLFLKQNRYKELEEITDDLDNCVNRVLTLTDNLLSWSLNQSGSLPCKPEKLYLNSIIQSNIETYSPLANQKSVELKNIDTEPVFVVADRNMLDTVLRNLINNALKFTSQNDKIHINWSIQDNFVKVKVQDSGTGISPDKLPYLFEADRNKSQPGTKGEKGNGLGLILCKEFVTKNRGNIWAESILGEGTSFYFTVPLADDQSSNDLSIENSPFTLTRSKL